MKRLSIRLLVAILTFIIGVVTASIWVSLNYPSNSEIALVSVSQEIKPLSVKIKPVSPPGSPIREIDFDNFTYPSGVIGEKGGFKLRQGELLPKRRDSIGRPLDMWLVLNSVVYGDITGDGNEEAIINLGWVTGGTATPNLIYIYTLRNEHPKLLWAFETGDRADGGYRNIYAENGELVLELLGKDKIIGTDLSADDGVHLGDCCATLFTRTRYLWDSKRFRQIGKAEILPMPQSNNSFNPSPR
jgi:hypothetical protein